MPVFPTASAAYSRRYLHFKYLITVLLAIALLLISPFPKSVSAEPIDLQPVSKANTSQRIEPVASDRLESASTASLFTKNCIGCHAGGGNVVRRSKTLKLKALKRYGYDNVPRISQIVTNGKGVMSAYRDRLTSQEIEAIAEYVLSQAENNWQ